MKPCPYCGATLALLGVRVNDRMVAALFTQCNLCLRLFVVYLQAQHWPGTFTTVDPFGTPVEMPNMTIDDINREVPLQDPTAPRGERRGSLGGP